MGGATNSRGGQGRKKLTRPTGQRGRGVAKRGFGRGQRGISQLTR